MQQREGKGHASPPPRVLIGPVVGLVTDSSARILLEVAEAADVTIVLWDAGGHGSEKEHRAALALPSKRATVFEFQNLAPNTRYCYRIEGVQLPQEWLACCGHFLTQPKGGYTISEAHTSPRFACVSCNKIFVTQRESTPETDLWQDLANRCKGGDIDIILHLGDQVYIDSGLYRYERGGKVLQPGSVDSECVWWVAIKMLEGMDKREWFDSRGDIEELFREVWRKTWMHGPTRMALAHASNLMIWDDHEIRDDWGDRATDREVLDGPMTSATSFLACIAYGLVQEYQRQLFVDVESPGLRDNRTVRFDNCSFHFHSFGDIGLIFNDVRGCKSFHHDGFENLPMLGTDQWNAMEEALDETRGIFRGCSVLLVLNPLPLAYASNEATMALATFVGRADDMFGNWASTKHLPELEKYLETVCEWRSRSRNSNSKRREAIFLCGDVHEGGESDLIRVHDRKEVIKQICSGSIANKAPEEHEAIVTNIIRGHSDSLCNGWEMRHGNWTRHRNYAILTVRLCDNVPVVDVFYQVSFDGRISSEMQTSSQRRVHSKLSMAWALKKLWTVRYS
eukprot:g4170.t1